MRASHVSSLNTLSRTTQGTYLTYLPNLLLGKETCHSPHRTLLRAGQGDALRCNTNNGDNLIGILLFLVPCFSWYLFV